jgi:uncharacterized Fe-S cluster-containing MiaB family protein
MARYGNKIRRQFYKKPHCFYCGKVMSFNPNSSNRVTRDHVSARSTGGMRKGPNVVLACANCNNRKGAKSLEEFRAECGVKTFYGETSDEYRRWRAIVSGKAWKIQPVAKSHQKSH